MSSEGEHDPVKSLLESQATAEMWRAQAGKWAVEARICSTFVRRMADTSTHYAQEAREVLKALNLAEATWIDAAPPTVGRAERNADAGVPQGGASQ